MRILLADDHAIVRRGLKELLAEEFPTATFGEAANAAQALQLAFGQPWDMVLLDIHMEGRSGLEVLEDIRKAVPHLPVLILSMYPEAEFAVRALRAGAAGYVSKASADSELVAAVKKVLAGGRYVSAALGEKLVSTLQQHGAKLPHETLSNREFEVMRLIARGKTLKEIAAALALSEKTVSTYHTRLFQKLGVHTDAEVTRYALQQHLVD